MGVTIEKLWKRLLLTTLLLSCGLTVMLIGAGVAYWDLASRFGDLQVENTRLARRVETQATRLDEAEQRIDAASRFALQTRRFMELRGHNEAPAPQFQQPVGVADALKSELNKAGLNVSEDDAAMILALLRKALVGF